MSKLNYFSLYRLASALAVFLLLPVFLFAKDASHAEKLAGTYRCWSFNAGGIGGRCTSPPLILNTDGTYQTGSEKGTFRIDGKSVELSESKFRGKGKFSGIRITFQYQYAGKKQMVTYLRQSAPVKKKKSDHKTQEPALSAQTKNNSPDEVSPTVYATLILRFPRSDNSVSWISTITLVPEGFTLENAPYRPEAIAVTDESKNTVRAYFRDLRAGTIYTVYAGTGFNNTPVAKMPLLRVTQDEMTIPLKASLPGASSLKNPSSPAETQASPPTEIESSPDSRPVNESRASPDLPLCNPGIPRYTQPECRDR